MKKLFTLFLLIFNLFSAPVKGGATETNSRIAGAFILDENVVKLYSDGNVEYNGKIKGTYSSFGSDAYKIKIDDGAWFVYLISGNNVYEVGAGSAGVISDFEFDPTSDYITITEIDGGEVTDDDLEALDLTSPELHLTDLFMVAEVNWEKGSAVDKNESAVAPADKDFLGIMTFCNPAGEYDGPTGKTAKEIMRAVEGTGYVMEDSTPGTFSIEDPIDEEFYEVDAVNYLYTKNDVTIFCIFPADGKRVEMDGFPFQITIDAPESYRREFVKNALANGFVNEGVDMGDYYAHKQQPSCVSFNVVSGDDAIIQINFFDSH